MCVSAAIVAPAGLPKEAQRRNEPNTASDSIFELRDMRAGIKKEPGTVEAGPLLGLPDIAPAILVDEPSSESVCGPIDQIS